MTSCLRIQLLECILIVLVQIRADGSSNGGSSLIVTAFLPKDRELGSKQEGWLDILFQVHEDEDRYNGLPTAHIVDDGRVVLDH